MSEICQSCGGAGEAWYSYEGFHGEFSERLEPCQHCHGKGFEPEYPPLRAPSAVVVEALMEEVIRIIEEERI